MPDSARDAKARLVITQKQLKAYSPIFARPDDETSDVVGTGYSVAGSSRTNLGMESEVLHKVEIRFD